MLTARIRKSSLDCAIAASRLRTPSRWARSARATRGAICVSGLVRPGPLSHAKKRPKCSDLARMRATAAAPIAAPTTASTPEIPSSQAIGPPTPLVQGCLSAEDQELLKEFIGRANDARGGGVAGGGQDHVDELLAQVHVGEFQAAADDAAGAELA